MGEPLVGFGGASVTAIDSLPEGKNGTCACFFGVDVEISRTCGRDNGGAATFLRRTSASMAPWAAHQRRLGSSAEYKTAYDVGILRGADVAENTALVGATLANGEHLPVAIGCDHTVSFWHAAGVASVRRFTYVYLDAHLDLGLHHPRGRRGLHNGNFVMRLVESGRVDEVVNIGARAWSTYDPAYAEPPVRIIRQAPWPELRDVLAALRGRDVYVSVDADVVDPASLPNVCCPEPLGFIPREVIAVLRWLASSCRVVGVDFSELLPARTLSHTGGLVFSLLYQLLAASSDELESRS